MVSIGSSEPLSSDSDIAKWWWQSRSLSRKITAWRRKWRSKLWHQNPEPDKKIVFFFHFDSWIERHTHQNTERDLIFISEIIFKIFFGKKSSFWSAVDRTRQNHDYTYCGSYFHFHFLSWTTTHGDICGLPFPRMGCAAGYLLLGKLRPCVGHLK